MGKKKDGKIRIPKEVLGFKVPKRTRKDLRKLLKLVDGPAARAVAISAASIALGFLAEKTAERKGPSGQRAGKAAGPAQSH